MYTHCPSCKTHFEITQEYLDIAHGKVRCGQCDHVFNALENLYNNDTDESASESSEATQDILKASETSTSNQSDNVDFSIPNVDIKEKMERIVASLSAATEELKNARKASTFHDASITKTPEQEDSPQADGISQTGDSLLDDESLSIETSLEVDETAPVKDALEIDETAPAEDALEINETAPAEDTLEIDEAAPAEDALEISETAPAEDALEINETTPAEDALEIGKTSPAEDVLEINEAAPDEDALEIDKTAPDEEELEIADFSENDLIQTHSPSTVTYNAHKVDQNDIDILNSLIGDSDQNTSDSSLYDELDDINKTLSDESSPLDDKLSSLDDEFDQLDSGDDLLAELEQLESDFLNNTQTSESHDSDKDYSQTESSSLTEPSETSDDFYTPAGFEDKGEGEIELDAGDVPSKSTQIQDEVAPSFLTQNDSSTSSPAAILGWLASTIVLLLILASQYLHFNSIKLSQDPEFRPFLESLCPLTGCSLPLIRAPKKVVTVTHDVRTHPTVKNALEIQLTFKNKAPYTQSYPVLEITFSNPVGEIIARRQFLPNEYMKSDSYYTSGLKSNQTQDINLKVVDPDPDSLLSFQFNYL